MSRKQLSFLALGLALGSSAWVWYGRGSTGGADEKAFQDHPTTISRTRVAALGRVEPRSEELYLAAAITGRLESVPVEEGSWIDQGDVVAILENADQVARVRAADAELAIARANLDRVRNGARPAERREAAAAVREAQAVVALAERDFKRQKGMASRALASEQDLDRAYGDQQVALARLAGAQQHLEVIDSAPRQDDLARAQAEVVLAEARIAEARATLEKSFVRTPIAGVVLRKLRRPGEQVTELGDAPILVVGDTSLLRVRAEVDEADIALVRLGQTAYVQADAYGERRFSGRVSRVGSVMGVKKLHSERPGERVDTRVLEVLIDLERDANLPVGLRVDAYLDLPDVATAK